MSVLDQIYVYDHGLPFSQSLSVDVLKPIYTMKRLARCLVIDGVPGTGKTTLAVEIAEHLQGYEVSEDQLAMGGLALMTKGSAAADNGHKIIIYDEAADLNKRGALSKFNRQLMMFFNKYRALNILLIIVLPVFWHLDSDLFDLGIIHGLVHLYNPQEHYTYFGVYDFAGLCYLRFYVEKFKHNRRLAYRKQHPYMRGEFLPLPPARQEWLDKVSLADKRKSIRRVVKKVKKL